MRIYTAILLPLTVAACGQSDSGVYDLPVATVFERLKVEDMTDFRNARQCGILIYFTLDSETNKSVTWTVTSGGKTVASFTARLTPLDANRTKVMIDVPPAPDGGEIYDGTKFYKRPALYQPIRPAIAELVDARIAQRPFDVWRIPDNVRVIDRLCSVQRGALESGSVRFRADGDDGADGLRRDMPTPEPSSTHQFGDPPDENGSNR